ncbi:MAG: type 1 glutamine amidotransferase [Planctomycetaceae bacterium]|nr:type 1 glutamine amidotransferase [Planctomycetales bacterium]MCB9927066.1 type 1 glutamine amidotransferase [Planctomycetaceae bacterium]
MTSLSRRLRYLLLQVRNANDPMRQQEPQCFAKAFGCDQNRITIFDILAGVPSLEYLSRFDVVVLGGSGDYSVADGGDWLPAALETMQELYDISKPTFASCWGFQAMAKALGGEVVTDMNRAELGTVQVRLTDVGKSDPVFGALGSEFLALMGHQDIVDRLPPEAILLASSDIVENQAFCFADKPIYCTQFHPELDRKSFLQRVEAYPQYVYNIAGMSLDDFARERCQDTPEVAMLLNNFLEHCFGSSI